MIVTIKQYKALRRRNARQKIKNDNKIIINLNCSQILQSNLILAKVTPFTRKLSFGKFLLLSYRSHNIFNYYWIFNILKKYVLFLINIHIKKTTIGAFSTHLRQPHKLRRTHRILPIIKRSKWIKGLLTNEDLLRLVPELWKTRIPHFFLLINKNHEELNSQFNEFIRMFLPTLFVVENTITRYKLDNVLFMLPGNTNSASFATWLCDLTYYTYAHSQHLVEKNISNFLK